MNYYQVTFKNKLIKPISVYADDIEDAKKRAIGEYRRTSGSVETLDMYSTAENTFESIKEI